MHMVAKCCKPFLLWLRETTKQPKEIPRNVLCEVATMLDILGLLTILSSSGSLRQPAVTKQGSLTNVPRAQLRQEHSGVPVLCKN